MACPWEGRSPVMAGAGKGAAPTNTRAHPALDRDKQYLSVGRGTLGRPTWGWTGPDFGCVPTPFAAGAHPPHRTPAPFSPVPSHASPWCRGRLCPLKTPARSHRGVRVSPLSASPQHSRAGAHSCQGHLTDRSTAQTPPKNGHQDPSQTFPPTHSHVSRPPDLSLGGEGPCSTGTLPALALQLFQLGNKQHFSQQEVNHAQSACQKPLTNPRRAENLGEPLS